MLSPNATKAAVAGPSTSMVSTPAADRHLHPVGGPAGGAHRPAERLVECGLEDRTGRGGGHRSAADDDQGAENADRRGVSHSVSPGGIAPPASGRTARRRRSI